MKTQSVSFTSKINFVDSKTFRENFCRGKLVDFRKPGVYIYEGDEIYTEELRTCAAGGKVVPKLRKAAGFHYYDDIISNMEIDNLTDELCKTLPQAEHGLMIGGKKLKFSPYSLENFDIILNCMKKQVKYLTIFREHKFPWSETNFHYGANNDTWTINSIFRRLTEAKEHDVLSKEALKEAFGEIHIAQGDELYIQGERIFL